MKNLAYYEKKLKENSDSITYWELSVNYSVRKKKLQYLRTIASWLMAQYIELLSKDIEKNL